jgi:hypothetical protein
VASTTPRQLRLAMAAVVLAAILAGLALGAVTAVRRDATNSVATHDERLMLAADQLYASLSDADATAATTFLRGGTEPADLRARYLADVGRASAQLGGLTRRVQGATEVSAVGEIGAGLPVYTGLIETARANNRQGFPVGAAYLRDASVLMRERILPAAQRLYAAQAGRLSDNQRSGTSTTGLVAALVVCGVALAVLVGVQVFLTWRTHRVFNIGLVAATVALAGLVAWAAVAMSSASSSLNRAQRNGSDAVQVLSAARILWLRAQADESLGLVARGGGDQYVQDVDVVNRLLVPPRGLLGEASRLAARTGSTAAIGDLTATWRAIDGEHANVARLEHNGDFKAAIRANTREAALGDRLNRGFGAQINAAQKRFDTAASDARTSLRGLTVGIPLLIVACVVLALVGLETRLKEYR